MLQIFLNVAFDKYALVCYFVLSNIFFHFENLFRNVWTKNPIKECFQWATFIGQDFLHDT